MPRHGRCSAPRLPRAGASHQRSARAGASRVRHPPSGREATCASLAASASALPIPAQPRKKRPDEFKLIGKSIERKDLRDKVNGKTVFGIDVVLPGMLHAALRMPPQAGGGVASFDADSVLKLPGVVAAVKVDGGVAVIADTFWRAREAVETLKVEFTPGPAAGLDTETIRARLRSGLDYDAAAVPFPDVDTQSETPKARPLDRAATERRGHVPRWRGRREQLPRPADPADQRGSADDDRPDRQRRASRRCRRSGGCPGSLPHWPTPCSPRAAGASGACRCLPLASGWTDVCALEWRPVAERMALRHGASQRGWRAQD